MNALALVALVLSSLDVTRFIAVGDTGMGNAGQREVARLMADKCQKDGCDFVIMLGDNIYPSGVTGVDDPQWIDKFEQPYAPLPIPFYPALGNHDYGSLGNLAESDMRGPEYEVRYSEKSQRWRMPGRYYQHSQGPIDFVALDTSAMLLGKFEQQRHATETYLKQSRAPWRIAYGHHPYYSNGKHGDLGQLDGQPPSSSYAGVAAKRFFDQTICGKVDVYLAGHDHNTQVFEEKCAGTTLLISGAGSMGGPISGRHPLSLGFETLSFLYFVASDTKLHFEVIAEDGITAYSTDIEHK